MNLFNCDYCNDQLGEAAYNPEHRLDELCIRQFNMYCTEEADTRCDACNQVQVVEASIPNPCWENLAALYGENCGGHSDSSRSPIVPSQTHSTPSNTNAPKETDESSLGMAPVLFFILIVVAIMLFICKKMWENQNKNDNDERLLSEDGASIRLDVHQPTHPVSGEYQASPHHYDYDRVDSGSGYHHQHQHSSSHNDHEYQPQVHGRQHSDQRYSASSFQSLSHASSNSREEPAPDAYHYQPNARQYRPDDHHSDHHSEGSYSRKDRDMSSNVPNSHRHQPYADSEERIMDAQNSLRSSNSQKESLRSRIAKARLQNVLPVVHETKPKGPGPAPDPVLPHPEHQPPPEIRKRNDSSTNQRQTRINTLLNQNTSTSSIYSGSIVYPAKPLQQDEESHSKESKGISDSGKSNNGEISDPEVPLRERIRRYSRSQERERRNSRGRSDEPEKRRSLVREDKRRSAERQSKSAENRFDRERDFQTGSDVPLRDRIKRFSQNRSASRSQPANEQQTSKGRRDRSRPRDEPSPFD